MQPEDSLERFWIVARIQFLQLTRCLRPGSLTAWGLHASACACGGCPSMLYTCGRGHLEAYVIPSLSLSVSMSGKQAVLFCTHCVFRRLGRGGKRLVGGRGEVKNAVMERVGGCCRTSWFALRERASIHTSSAARYIKHRARPAQLAFHSLTHTDLCLAAKILLNLFSLYTAPPLRQKNFTDVGLCSLQAVPRSLMPAYDTLLI